jgi:transcriptional regulator with XRE-family HTH domain
MNVGTKIKKLRESRNMSQDELALELGISQPTVCNIETGAYEKIDFELMGKICRIFDKDWSYFTTDNVINNHIKENNGQWTGCENITIHNNYPESILTEIQNLINENKLLKAKIEELESKK